MMVKSRARGWNSRWRRNPGHSVAGPARLMPGTANASRATMPRMECTIRRMSRDEVAMALAQAQGLRSVFETARMYAGPAPAGELGRLYGITSFELG